MFNLKFVTSVLDSRLLAFAFKNMKVYYTYSLIKMLKDM